ncbi:MAG: pentapeptide repeat-containing protein [Flavobacteriaceae bacterium]|nr:pentapeptide repeat-containing protein [Flavobacteriaceae bacterium]
MNRPYINDKTYSNIDFTQTSFQKAEYDNCTFINCNFSEIYLSAVSFLECDFVDCNLSGVKIKDTSFNKVNFKGCKLLGIAFYECNPFLLAFRFEKCNLNHSQFNGLNLSNTTFLSNQIQNVDFTDTNLSHAKFSQCDLKSSTFENTVLKNADFSQAKNYSINPSKNTLTQAKFSREHIEGLLQVFNLHIV